ncbi:MAG: hypothetical protein WCP62_13210, partial [Planctomycetota bacterium]
METPPVRLIRSDALSTRWLDQLPHRAMASWMLASWMLLIGWSLILTASAQELPKAVDLFPSSTQAFAALPNSSGFLKNWKQTQLGELADDERMKEFWSNQQEELRRRLASAGWQLSLKIEDLENLCSGQAALGLISRPEVTEKPFSLALLIDVADRAEALETFFKRVGTDMESQKGTLKKLDIGGIEVKHYSIPKLSTDGRARDSYFAVSKNQLLIADDLASIQQLIDAQSTPPEDSLAKSELYTKVQQRIVRDQHLAEVEYFVKPLGLGKLLRSIAVPKGKKQVDLLKLLEDQGFGSILVA